MSADPSDVQLEVNAPNPIELPAEDVAHGPTQMSTRESHGKVLVGEKELFANDLHPKQRGSTQLWLELMPQDGFRLNLNEAGNKETPSFSIAHLPIDGAEVPVNGQASYWSSEQKSVIGVENATGFDLYNSADGVAHQEAMLHAVMGVTGKRPGFCCLEGREADEMNICLSNPLTKKDVFSSLVGGASLSEDKSKIVLSSTLDGSSVPSFLKMMHDANSDSKPRYTIRAAHHDSESEKEGEFWLWHKSDAYHGPCDLNFNVEEGKHVGTIRELKNGDGQRIGWDVELLDTLPLGHRQVIGCGVMLMSVGGRAEALVEAEKGRKDMAVEKKAVFEKELAEKKEAEAEAEKNAAQAVVIGEEETATPEGTAA